MPSYLWLLCVLGTVICWGAYGPVIHEGQVLLKSAWKAFLLVGVAYVVVAVLVPIGIIKAQGEALQFASVKGMTWATIAGVLGAVGALFVIGALKNGGKPVYVMPLVFGLAPVVNVAASWMLHPPAKAAHPMFFVGFLVLSAGAGLVLYFKPA